MYLHRSIEYFLQKATRQTKVILITGARQTGKTTVIKNTFPEFNYITLDDENMLMLAKQDPSLFFKDQDFPLIIDEVQYAEELFRTIKLLVDRNTEKGQMILTGSQTHKLMEAASSMLVGRMSVLEMSPLSMREIFKVDFNLPFIPKKDYIKERKKHLNKYDDLWKKIHRGSMPELLDEERDWEWFYRDYVRTYLERDIRRVINLKDELKFRSFLVSLAARSGQIVVYEDIASDVGVDIKTVQNWLSIVETSGIVKLIHTYKKNIIKRMIKSPKLFFMDTGLMCYLVGWKTYEQAKNGAMSGSIFETFVVSEIIKSYLNAGRDIRDTIFYYRDKDKKEIDLLILEDGIIHPIEIKLSANVKKDMIKNFSVLKNKKEITLGEGAVVCLSENIVPISEDVEALPIDYL
ncbi:MAG: ATP-binding protein [Erysipelotrichaceae bacterium]|nr:ATP-binding protein [Erysipelotrichaceae bacterium]